jgi:CRP-like cAMP-binding protein
MSGASIRIEHQRHFFPLWAPPEWSEATAQETIKKWDELFGFRRRDLLAQGAYLFHEGMPVKEVFLLVEGLILLSCSIPSADGGFHLGLRLPGQLIEPCAHNLGVTYFVSAQAALPSRFIRVSAAEVERREREVPGVSIFLRRLLARDFYEATQFLVQLRNSAPPDRLCHFLHLLASALGLKSTPGRIQIPVPLHDKQIADILGISPRQLRRVKKELHDRGRLQISEERGWCFLPK